MKARFSSAGHDSGQDAGYRQAIKEYGRDIARFVAGYERDPARRQELLQDIHVVLWQSFSGFKEQCSLRTWVYRVAHNVGVSHVQRGMKVAERSYLGLEEAESVVSDLTDIELTERRLDLERLFALIHRLAPLDREVMLLYLEDMDAASIGDITGLSARNVGHCSSVRNFWLAISGLASPENLPDRYL